MEPIKSSTSACRYCRHYQPQGRRGGMCKQLGSLVQAGWKACSLAIPPFAPSWETLEDAWSLPDATPGVSSCEPVSLNAGNHTISPVDEIVKCTSEDSKSITVGI